MKKIIFITIILFGILSCTKNDDNQHNQFIGKWEWTSTEGGLNSQIHDTPTSTGKTITLIILNDNDYTILKDGIVNSQGTYDLNITNDYTTGGQSQFIKFSENENNPNIIIIFNGIIKRVNGVTLTIDDNNPDGIGMIFNKL